MGGGLGLCTWEGVGGGDRSDGVGGGDLRGNSCYISYASSL